VFILSICSGVQGKISGKEYLKLLVNEIRGQKRNAPRAETADPVVNPP